MTELAAALADYLTLRRSLGYKLERAGEVLADFVAHLDRAGCEHVSIEGAVAWATLSANPSRRGGRSASAWCGTSPATCMQSIRPIRFPHPA